MYSMPKLQLLHLAGNAFTGPAFDPAQTSFPPNLTDLSLSNNMLSRHIPSPLQRQAGMLAKLDLSYNKLNGTLNDMQMPSSLLSMIVNRFSGSVPSALLNKPRKPMNFSILSGNAFTCAEKSSGLPQFDPGLEDVDCGSNKMNTYMYVLSGLLAALGAAWFYLSPRSHLQGDHEDKADALDELPHIKTFLEFMTQMIRLLQVLAVLCILLLMPIYGALTATSETQTDSYIWTISASYKSGASAASGLFFLFSAVLVAAFTLSLKHQAISLRRCCGGGVSDAFAEDDDLINDEGDKEDTYHHQKKKSDEMVLSILAFRMFFIFSLNTIFAFTTNVGFVFLMNIATAQQQTLAQIGMSVLNAVWDKTMAFMLSTRLLYFGLTENDIRFAVPGMPLISYFREGEVFTASLGIFSQVLAPIAASMVQSPNCFKALFYKPDPVESSYSAPVSYIENIDSIRLDFEISNLRLFLSNVNFSTIATDVVTNQVIFYAPFQYLFQCSSAILSSYAPVMLNSAITKAFVGPMKLYGVRKLLDSGKAPKAARNVLLNMLPKLSRTRRERQEALEKVEEKLRLKDLNDDRVILGPRAFRQKHKAELDEARQLWSRNDFFVGLITDLALLLSFGVACPPLGVAIIISILSSVLLQRHLISAFVAYTSRPASISPTDVKKLQAIIDADAVNAGDVRELLRLEKDVKFDTEGTPVFFARWMVLTVSCSFLSFFVFDTAGDQQGAAGAAWAFVVQILVPLAVAIAIEILFRSRVVSFCRTHSESVAAAKANDASREQRRRSSGSISFRGSMEMEMVAPSRRSLREQLPRLSSSSSRPQHERKSFSFPKRPSSFSADRPVLSPLPLSSALACDAEAEGALPIRGLLPALTLASRWVDIACPLLLPNTWDASDRASCFNSALFGT
jgi:hypothetical protein